MNSYTASGISFFRNFVRNLPRPWKQGVLVAFDLAALFLAAWLAFKIRLGFSYAPNAVQYGLMLVAPVIAIPVFIRMGLYRALLRYLPDRALWTIASAMVIGTLSWIALIFLVELSGSNGAPRTIPILYWLIGTGLTAGSRFAIRAFLSDELGGASNGKRALIYGAGSAGRQLAAALRSSGDNSIAGFVDDNPKLWGTDIAGLRVLSPKLLADLVAEQEISDIILSIPSAQAERRMAIASALAELPVKLRTLPSIAELAAGKYVISQLREIDVEDLLGRTAVAPDPVLLKSVVSGKRVLVTGAGGSIGSELCRLVSMYDPAEMLLIDLSESALYEIEKQLAVSAPEVAVVPILASVADADRVEWLFRSYSIDVVFHAAAYKHVPMLEKNVIEGIRNNVIGTETLVEAAFNAGTRTFVLISTDKAVHPSSVMGATKRWSELIVRQFADFAEREQTGQHFLAVRFGNVLGSTGSVVPLFKEQIARGGPVTLTDDRMTRYFMAIPEAAQLIVQAAGLSSGGETFLLDMGEPVSIRALAENMIRLAGLAVKSPENPDGVAIDVIGMRPGEKLSESLYYDPQLSVATAHPKIMKAMRRGVPRQDMRQATARLRKVLAGNDPLAAINVLFEIVEGRMDEPEEHKLAQ